MIKDIEPDALQLAITEFPLGGVFEQPQYYLLDQPLKPGVKHSDLFNVIVCGWYINSLSGEQMIVVIYSCGCCGETLRYVDMLAKRLDRIL